MSVNIFKNESDVVSFSAGQQIFGIGEPGEEMFAVKSGEVEIRIGDHIMETISAGGIFGEMALVDKAPRSATATAISDCELVRIDEHRFQTVVKYNPLFALQVLKVSVERLRRMNDRMA